MMKCPQCGHPDTSHNDAGCFHDDGAPCFCRMSGEAIRFPEQYEIHREKVKDVNQEPYERKFKQFIKMCSDAKRHQVDAILISSPEVLGDNYQEIMESLSRLANSGLKLFILHPNRRK